MHFKKAFHLIVLLVILGSYIFPASSVSAKPAADVTAYDLILAMNTLRTSYGLAPLVEDPIINAVAQATAEIMAANQMSWHIGNVSGRLTSAGYGGGAKVWGTENFAVGNMSIDEIMVVWADPSHMIPAVNPAYCNVGAGTAKSANGMTYYVLQAAYTSNKACGEYKSPVTSNPQPGGDTGEVAGVPQIIVPVKIATPDSDGKIFHVVAAGQSFWAIAVAYKVTIKDIEIWNNISKDSKLQVGQRLFIPSSNTIGYATPTPVGMVVAVPPDGEGKIVHTVQTYQTLTTIAQAYGVKIDTILSLNRWQQDWPLQIGQKLIISPGNITPSPTPRPLSPIEKLTPANDGKYYHVIKAGETLSWVASLYEVNVYDLMAWNGLSASSILHPEDRLVLQVTPPATTTPTPAPATATPTTTEIPPSPTTTPSATYTFVPVRIPETSGAPGNTSAPILWIVSIGLVASGLALAGLATKSKRH